MNDGSKACAFFAAANSNGFCEDIVQDAECPGSDIETASTADNFESNCKADDRCAFRTGEYTEGSCEPFDPCQAETTATPCDAIEGCFWFDPASDASAPEAAGNKAQCVSEEETGATGAADLLEQLGNVDEKTECSMFFSETHCKNAPKPDNMTHTRCVYREEQCFKYDVCRTADANIGEEECEQYDCSWKRDNPDSLEGLCTAKLSDSFDSGDYSCVPVDFADVGSTFSTNAPTTAASAVYGCCLISRGTIFDKELTCLDDETKQECNDVEDEFRSNSNSGTGDGAVFKDGECKEVRKYGKYTCQQGKDAYDTTTITTATTVPKVNTQVKPDTRIFVQLTDSFQNQMYLNGQQSSTTPSKLLKAFQPILNLPPSIIANGNSGVNGKSMISYRAGGIEIKFPASLGAGDKPELADLRQGVESANKRATGSRQRRAKAPGHKLTYLSMAGARQLVKNPAEYTQREAYIAGIEMYNTATVAAGDVPTAPIPTLPPPPETTKAVVAAVKTLPPTKPRTTSTEAPPTTQPTTQPTIPPKTDGAGQVVLTTVTVTTTTTLPLDRSDAEAVAAFLAEQAAKATKKPAAADADELDAQNTAATAKSKTKIKGGTIAVVVVVLVLLMAAGAFVIYCMKKRLDHVASDPNYVKGGGGGAYGNPAYEGASIDEANEGYLDIQEAARKANKKPAKKGGLVRQESLC